LKLQHYSNGSFFHLKQENNVSEISVDSKRISFEEILFKLEKDLKDQKKANQDLRITNQELRRECRIMNEG